MNWLAHAFLSKPQIECRLGNLLADLVKGRDRAGMPAAFLEGVRHHQSIDVFTDTHPIVHRSRARIGGDFRHTTGILVDVFYDHFLAIDWEQYAPESLDAFTARLYAEIRACPIELPGEARFAAERIVSDDPLGSYRQLDGIEKTLRRLSWRVLARTGRDLRLERGVAELVAHFDELHADFTTFFPQLQAHVRKITQAQPQVHPSG